MRLQVRLLFALLLAASARAATLRGTVTHAGRVEPQPATPVTRDQRNCGDSQPGEAVKVGKHGELANAVVFLADVAAPGDDPPGETVLDQVGCRYVPHVLAVRAGTRLVARNSDNTLHTVHGRAGERTVFNQAQPLKGMRTPFPLSRAEVIRVGCDAGHTWMTAWVHVFDHPYFAVTDENGRFEIKSVPPGKHTLKLWHESFGTKTQSVQVGADTNARLLL